MNCPSCNTPLPPEATFCSKCGFQVKLACPRCNAILASGEAFCSNCGTPLHAHLKSRWLYILSALLPFGIHDFYAGRIKSAIVVLIVDLLSIYFFVYSCKKAMENFHIDIFNNTHNSYTHYSYNNDDSGVFLMIAMMLVVASVIFRLVECVAVKHDGKGVKMK